MNQNEEALKPQRGELMQQLAECFDQIAEIDRQFGREVRL